MSDECSNMQVINDWFRDNFKYQTLAYDHNIAMVRILVASLCERSLDAPRDWARDIKDDFKFQSAALDQKKAKRLISFTKHVVELSRAHPLAEILSVAPQRKGNILFP